MMILSDEPQVVCKKSRRTNNNNNSRRHTTTTGECIAEPTESDIKCGKDKTFGRHHGNKGFTTVIDSWVAAYQGAETKHDKMRMTRHIVSLLRNNNNARFLRQTEVGWEEISDSMARDKVSHALRFAARRAKKKAAAGAAAANKKKVMRKNMIPLVAAARREECMSSSSSSSSSSLSEESDAEEVGDLFERQQDILRQAVYSAHGNDASFSATNAKVTEYVMRNAAATMPASTRQAAQPIPTLPLPYHHTNMPPPRTAAAAARSVSIMVPPPPPLPVQQIQSSDLSDIFNGPILESEGPWLDDDAVWEEV